MPEDIREISDLEKLPILTKAVIKEHWDEFKPANLSSMKYRNQATGGSTGTPMRYRLSKHDRFLGGALLYRGWGYGGYELGDKMVFLAGSSLNVGKGSRIHTMVHEAARNIKMLSSYDMEESNLHSYVKTLDTIRPRFIRGYAYSIYFFARWLEENHAPIPPIEGVFTTAEKLFPNMRKTIGDVFDCDVYDNYGLNDGGVSAYECPEHAGLHMDTERSIMEIVDESGHQAESGKGKILATSLYNYAMPFIRYDTGDEGFLSGEPCSCGRSHQLLNEVLGRHRDMLITPEGKYIHGGLLSRLFSEMPHVKEFQVVQRSINSLDIYIIPELNFDERDFDQMRSAITSRSPGWILNIHIVDMIERTGAGKYKFIINEVTNV